LSQITEEGVEDDDELGQRIEASHSSYTVEFEKDKRTFIAHDNTIFNALSIP